MASFINGDIYADASEIEDTIEGLKGAKKRFKAHSPEVSAIDSAIDILDDILALASDEYDDESSGYDEDYEDFGEDYGEDYDS